MRQLKDILQVVKPAKIVGDVDIAIDGLSIDSSNIKDLFVCIKGTNFDSHSLIDDVIAKGTKAVVVEKLPSNCNEQIAYILVDDSKIFLGNLASAYYDFPSHKLSLVGVTGTNGKTTVATMLYNLFTELGYTCGLISTVENKIAQKVLPSTHTTPNAIKLQELLHEMVREGCSHVFMEVSSHAVHQHRIAGAQFTGAVFTNITHDHLDYHKTFDEYIKAKKMFFDGLSTTSFVIHIG